MRKQQKRINRTRLLLTILILFGLSPLALLLAINSRSVKSFTVDPTLEQDFERMYVKYADVNSGISIQILSSYNAPTETDFGGLAEYAVYNHSQEPIIFPDSGFGLRIFTIQNDAIWKEIKQNTPFMENPTTMMPSGKVIDSFGNLKKNSLFLRYSDFDTEIPSMLRLYVAGTGQKTHINYVAYIDLSLDR